VAAVTTAGITAVMSAVVVVSLIIFLVTKEVATGGRTSSSQLLARFLTVGILPLLLVFTVILAVTVVGIVA